VRSVRTARSLVTGALLGRRAAKVSRLRPLDFGPFGSDLDRLTPERRVALDHLLTGGTVASIQARLTEGSLTAEELVIGALHRIRRLEPTLCAVVELNPDALVEARAADARRREGAVMGDMDGIPVTVKDNIGSSGPMHTTGGAVVLADHIAQEDSPVVASLRAAGSVLVGKANLSELAGAVCRQPGVSAVGGASRNPYGAGYSPGGSSSGSAVAVAAGLSAVSVGTETSGSLLAPSAFNGVVGIKPTHGRTDGAGIIPLVRRQDTAGAVGRCVADAAALLAAISDVVVESGSLDPDALSGVRVGVLRADILSQRTPLEDTSDAEEVLARIMEGLLDSGAIAVVAEVSEESPGQFDRNFAKVVLGGLTWDTTDFLAANTGTVTDLESLQAFNLAHPRRRMPAGQFFVDLATLSGITREGYEAASDAACRRAREMLEASFDAAGVDLLVSITNRHSSLYATGGFPAANVPLGLRSNGMPTGATLIGRRNEDELLVDRAFAVEEATCLRVAPGLDGR